MKAHLKEMKWLPQCHKVSVRHEHYFQHQAWILGSCFLSKISPEHTLRWGEYLSLLFQVTIISCHSLSNSWSPHSFSLNTIVYIEASAISLHCTSDHGVKSLQGPLFNCVKIRFLTEAHQAWLLSASLYLSSTIHRPITFLWTNDPLLFFKCPCWSCLEPVCVLCSLPRSLPDSLLPSSHQGANTTCSRGLTWPPFLMLCHPLRSVLTLFHWTVCQIHCFCIFSTPCHWSSPGVYLHVHLFTFCLIRVASTKSVIFVHPRD